MKFRNRRDIQRRAFEAQKRPAGGGCRARNFSWRRKARRSSSTSRSSSRSLARSKGAGPLPNETDAAGENKLCIDGAQIQSFPFRTRTRALSLLPPPLPKTVGATGVHVQKRPSKKKRSAVIKKIHSRLRLHEGPRVGHHPRPPRPRTASGTMEVVWQPLHVRV